MELQKQLDLFHATPPRMFPNQDFQRPMIENLLAMTAATEPAVYEERLETYNRFCDELGVARFARVSIHKEEVPAEATPAVESTEEVTPEETVEPKDEVKEESTEETVEEIVEEKPKRGRRKKSESSPIA